MLYITEGARAYVYREYSPSSINKMVNKYHKCKCNTDPLSPIRALFYVRISYYGKRVVRDCLRSLSD